MVRVPLTAQEVAQGRRLGELLRATRGSRPQTAVARTAGISVQTLRKIESGRIPTPSFATVAVLAGTLGLSLDGIWRDIRTTPDAPPERHRTAS